MQRSKDVQLYEMNIQDCEVITYRNWMGSNEVWQFIEPLDVDFQVIGFLEIFIGSIYAALFRKCLHEFLRSDEIESLEFYVSELLRHDEGTRTDFCDVWNLEHKNWDKYHKFFLRE